MQLTASDAVEKVSQANRKSRNHRRFEFLIFAQEYLPVFNQTKRLAGTRIDYPDFSRAAFLVTGSLSNYASERVIPGHDLDRQVRDKKLYATIEVDQVDFRCADEAPRPDRERCRRNRIPAPR